MFYAFCKIPLMFGANSCSGTWYYFISFCQISS